MRDRHRQISTHAAQRGFGLLEAIVALVFVSGLGVTLLIWLQQNLDTTERLNALSARLQIQRNVLAWSDTINPMQQPQGEARIGSLKIRWKAEPITKPEPQVGYLSGQGLYDVALYRVDLSALPVLETTSEQPSTQRTDTRAEGEIHFTREMVGYNLVRSNSNIFGQGSTQGLPP